MPPELENVDTLTVHDEFSIRLQSITQNYQQFKQTYAVQNNLQHITPSAVNSLNIVKPGFPEELDRIVDVFHTNKPLRMQTFEEEESLTHRPAVRARSGQANAAPRGRPPAAARATAPASVSTMQIVRAIISRVEEAEVDNDEDNPQQMAVEPPTIQSSTSEEIPPLASASGLPPSTQGDAVSSLSNTVIKQEPLDNEELRARESSGQTRFVRNESQATSQQLVSSMIGAFLGGSHVPIDIPEEEDESEEGGKKKRKKRKKKDNDEWNPQDNIGEEQETPDGKKKRKKRAPSKPRKKKNDNEKPKRTRKKNSQAE